MLRKAKRRRWGPQWPLSRVCPHLMLRKAERRRWGPQWPLAASGKRPERDDDDAGGPRVMRAVIIGRLDTP